MKRFHATCTYHSTQRHDGLGGVGGKASLGPSALRKVYCYRSAEIAGAVECTIISTGTKIDDDTYECVVEVADEYEAKLLAAGLKPVADVPESDEQFVKRHYPNAACSSAASNRHTIRYGDIGGDFKNMYSADWQSSPALAWAQAAKEVREHLATKHPQQSTPQHEPQPPAPRTRLFYNVRIGGADISAQFNYLHGDDAKVWAHECPASIPVKVISRPGCTCTIEVSEPHIETAEKWLGATISTPATAAATIATTPDPTPTNETPTTAKPMTQPTQQSWIQRERDEAKNLNSDARTAQLVAAVISTLIFAAATAGIVDAVAKGATPWIVFLGLAAPMLVTSATYFWIVVYAIATCDYVPPTPAPKVKPATLEPQHTLEPRPASRRTFGRFVWWALSSAAKVALGYGVYWLQSNWSAVCFDLGAFLQRISGGV